MARNVHNLKHAVSPILWINWIFCMGVFEIPLNRPRYVLSIIYVFLLSATYFLLLYGGTILFAEIFTLDWLIFHCVATINILVATCSVILSWIKWKDFNRIIMQMIAVDDTLKILGIKKDYNKAFRSSLSYLVIWLLIMILLNAMHVLWVWNHADYLCIIYTSIYFGLPIMLNSVVDITFIAVIRGVKLRFQTINHMVNDMVLCVTEESIFKIHNNKIKHTTTATIRPNYENNKEMSKHVMQTLQHLHLEVTRIARGINGSFCLQLLLEMTVHFTVVTAVSYSLYFFLFDWSRHGFECGKIIATVVWALVYSFKIIIMNDICTKVSNEAYKTGEIVQTFEGFFLDDELREEIQQFTQQILLNSLNFTAAGFFTINNALTGKFFATVTTYVVILIQMGAPV